MGLDAENWCSLEEIAEYLGVTKDTIRNWIKKHTCQRIKLGGSGSLKFQKLIIGSKVERAH